MKHILFSASNPQVGRLYLAIETEALCMHHSVDVLYSSTLGPQPANVSVGKAGANAPLAHSLFDLIEEDGNVVLELHDDNAEHVYIPFQTLKSMMSPTSP